jgi:hypothetical protein
MSQEKEKNRPSSTLPWVRYIHGLLALLVVASGLEMLVVADFIGNKKRASQIFAWRVFRDDPPPAPFPMF